MQALVDRPAARDDQGLATVVTLSATDIEDIEIQSLLDTVYLCRGHDFRHYSFQTVKRRLQILLEREKLQYFSELTPLVLHDERFLRRFLHVLSINVTEMFRDPDFYLALQQQVFPLLQTFPFFKIWHAGCATGEEAYTLAILLEEYGLYDRARIYATDNNKEVIAKAKEGIYKSEDIARHQQSYEVAGGKGAICDHFYSKYGYAKIDEKLKRHITFAHHDLTRDGVFAEAQLIICRNVLIYFNKNLKQRVLHLFHRSLTASGIFCLGQKESLEHIGLHGYFEVVDRKQRIYKKAKSTITGNELDA